MPALYDSLIRYQGLTPHKAWRVAYVIPFIIITAVALAMLFTCQDTPTGKWSERHIWIKHDAGEPAIKGNNNTTDSISMGETTNCSTPTPAVTPPMIDPEKKQDTQTPEITTDEESQTQPQFPSLTDTYSCEAVVTPTLKQTLKVTFSLSTMALAMPYACSFGSELAINSILGAYYSQNFKTLGQTESANWAAMFGLLNVVCRPAGGLISDLLYKLTGTVWSKKIWLVFLGVVMGAFELAIGLSNPKSEATMFGLVGGLAFFLEASNGASFALVPFAHPFANGLFFSLPLSM